MSKASGFLNTISSTIATVIGAIAHAIVAIVTLPFRALGKLFGGGKKPATRD